MRLGIRRWLLQAYRAAVLVGVVVIIHFSATGNKALPPVEISIDDVGPFYEKGVVLGDDGPVAGSRAVLSASGDPVGYVVRTSPRGDRYVGYSGPTDSLLAFDGESILLGWKILQSKDTPEHVELVREDAAFAGQFVGKSWDELAGQADFQGVSRATLTSLAIRESIALRLSGRPPNLRFPKPIGLDEVQEIFPEAQSLSEPEGAAEVSNVLDGGGEVLGVVLRTAYLGERAKGFQGLTDVLIALSPDREIIKTMRIRSSLDNEPYVGDMGFDDYFMGRFDGQEVSQAAALADDLTEEGIEGVSGATASSYGVVAAVREASRDLIASAGNEGGEGEKEVRAASIGGKDLGMAAMIGLALLISFTRLRGIKLLRAAFLVALVVYLGFLHGELISQALLVGWAQSGVSWLTTLGLVALVAVAFVIPWATGHQVYCHHLCPHGAAQQLLGKIVPWKIKVPANLGRLLGWLPGILVGLVVVIAIVAMPFNLSALEPFDAYGLWFAGGVTVIIAIVGLVASAFIPMAYCRYGCPTGAVLKFVRKSGGDFVKRDWLALLLLVTAGCLLWLR